MYTNTYTLTYTYIQSHTHIHSHTYNHVHTYSHTHVYTNTNHTHTLTHTNAQTHTHTSHICTQHTHTYVHNTHTHGPKHNIHTIQKYMHTHHCRLVLYSNSMFEWTLSNLDVYLMAYLCHCVHTCLLVRSSSHSTFDSMEFSRFSDDMDRENEDRVAVLEFELRKAFEMIKSLRGSLTKATGEC